MMVSGNKGTMFWLAPVLSLVAVASSASNSSTTTTTTSTTTPSTSTSTTTTTTIAPKLGFFSENSNLYFVVPVASDLALAEDNGTVPRLFVRYSHGKGASLDDSMVTMSVLVSILDRNQARMDARMEAMETSYQQKIEALNNRVDEEVRQRKVQRETIYTNITLEEGERKEEDDVLGQAIEDEAEGRESADQGLGSDIANEKSDRELADTALDGRIDEEVSKRKSADQNLLEDISQEKDARIGQDDSLRQAITEEEKGRGLADTALGGRITGEKDARMGQDDSLRQAITEEEKGRGLADTALGDRITGEKTARKSADDILNGAVGAEETARVSADGDLGGRIGAEESARKAADEVLDRKVASNFNSEKNARVEADKGLSVRINGEETARKLADGGLGVRISAEETARKSADGGLGSRINGEANARQSADGGLGARITGEASARSSKDTAISSDIVQIKADLKALTPSPSCRAAGGGSGLKKIKLKKHDQPVSVYCEMGWNGGGWDTLMAIDGSSSEFNFDASHWKGTSTHRETDGVGWGSNNKYHSFNYGEYCELYAWWRDPYDGAQWSWTTPSGFDKNWTPLKYFNTARVIASPYPWSVQNHQEWTRSGNRFSMQHKAGRLAINQCTGGNSCSRWGFHTNENGWGDLSSNDAGGGLGIRHKTNDGRSAGDWITCCVAGSYSNSGRNRGFDVRLLGRACN